eukprot:gene17099-biopygen4864
MYISMITDVRDLPGNNTLPCYGQWCSQYPIHLALLVNFCPDRKCQEQTKKANIVPNSQLCRLPSRMIGHDCRCMDESLALVHHGVFEYSTWTPYTEIGDNHKIASKQPRAQEHLQLDMGLPVTGFSWKTAGETLGAAHCTGAVLVCQRSWGEKAATDHERHKNCAC